MQHTLFLLGTFQKGKKKGSDEEGGEFGWFSEKESAAAVLADVVESRATYSLWNMGAAEIGKAQQF